MPDPIKPGMPAPSGPSQAELEERWKEVVDVLGESPRDVDLLIKAGDLSEQLNRRPEAYNYYHKALTLDPSKGFLVPKLKALATGPKQVEEVTKISKRPTSFTASLNGLFTYPVHGKGFFILVMGALLLWFARLLAAHSLSMAGFTIAGIVTAYLCMFYIDVCHTTVGGEDHLPDWPDPLRLHEFGVDIGKFFVASIVSFLPVIILVVAFGATLWSSGEDPHFIPAKTLPAHGVRPAHSEFDPDDDDDRKPATSSTTPAPATAPQPPPVAPSVDSKLGMQLVLVLAILVFIVVGLVYLPMAKLSNIVMGSPFTCLNFPFVFKSIGAAKQNYLICLGCYFGVTLVMGVAEFVVGRFQIILFTGLLLAFLELYGMTVLMRLLGLFYRMSQAKLGWMAD